MSKKSSLLIVSFVFPPHPGIGGRRWTKFAKNLVQRGHDVSVLYCESPFAEKSVWDKDLDNIKISRYCLPFNYPRSLVSHEGRGLLNSLRFRFSKHLVKIRTKGNYYDRSVFCKEHLDRIISAIINERGIDTIVVTGPPFALMYYVLQQKENYPTVKFISDFRDPWTEHDFGYIDQSLANGRRYKEEVRRENEVLAKSDIVFAVSDAMRNSLIGKMGGIATEYQKIVCVPNGYDEDDFSGISVVDSFRRMDNRIVLFHAGSIGNDKEYQWRSFFEMLIKLREIHPDLFERIGVQFVGNTSPEMRALSEKLGLQNTIEFIGWLSQKEVLFRLAKADFALWFKYHQSAGEFGTKFYEYVYLRKYILLFSVEGAVSHYLKEHKLGVRIRGLTDFADTLKNYQSGNLNYSSSFDRSAFSVNTIAATLEKYL